jgi:hypothetical protein
MTTHAQLEIKEIPVDYRPSSSILRYYIVVIDEEGQALMVVPGTHRRKREGKDGCEELLAMLEACNDCLLHQIGNIRVPAHRGGVTCLTGESIAAGGTKAHCDCEACFGVRK